MGKHIANINNYIVSIDSDGILNAPGLKSSVIEHPTEGTGNQGNYLVADGLGGWSWSSPTLAEGSRDIEPFSISSIGGLFTMINFTGYYTMFHTYIDAEFSRISLYTLSATSDASGTIVAGVFSNSNFHPATSLSQATTSFNNVTGVQEIIVDFNNVHLSSNNKYWIGIAVDTTDGELHLAKSIIGSTDNLFALAASGMLSTLTLSAPATGVGTPSSFNFYYRLHNPNGASGTRPYHLVLGLNSNYPGLFRTFHGQWADLNELFVRTQESPTDIYNGDLVNSTFWRPSIAGVFQININMQFRAVNQDLLVEEYILLQKLIAGQEHYQNLVESNNRRWGVDVNEENARVFTNHNTISQTVYAVPGDSFKIAVLGNSKFGNDIWVMIEERRFKVSITKVA